MDNAAGTNSSRVKMNSRVQDDEEDSEEEVWDSEGDDETIARIQRAHYAQAAAMNSRRRATPKARPMSHKRKMEAVKTFHDFTKKLKKDTGIRIRGLVGNNILELSDFSSETSESDSDGLSEEEFVVDPNAVKELNEENESYIDPETGDFVEKQPVKMEIEEPPLDIEMKPDERKTLSISDIIDEGDLDSKNVEIAEVEESELCTEKAPEELIKQEQEEGSQDFDIAEKLKEMGEISVKPVKKEGEDENATDEGDKQTENDDDDKKLPNPNALNVRRNIREVMDEKNLDASTLTAQRQESERLARVQEQQRIIREVQRQIAMNRQNKIHQKTLSLLQGGSSLLKKSTPGQKMGLPNRVMMKLSSGDIKKTTVKQGQLEVTKILKPTTSGTVVQKPEQKTDKKEVVEIVDSSSGEESSSSSSDSDDCIMLSDSEVPPSPEAEDDPNNSGLHVNDAYNIPDEQGRVQINIGHPENEEDIFLAPQIARVIKPHQIGGVRFLFDNIIESVERFSTSTGFGCILAHSMGLGKTLQIVCFCDIFLRHTTSKTVLCIMPINTLQNWVAEFNMWLPLDASTSPLTAHGEVRPRNFPIYVLNDSHKTLQMRAKVVKDWTSTGGVLMIGYELYRLLSMKKDKKPRKKKKAEIKAEEKEREEKKAAEAVNEDTQSSDMTNLSKPEESREDGDLSNKTEDSEIKKEEKDNSPTDEDKKLLDEMYEALVKPGPDLVICDEGHRIKNSHSNISFALKQMRTKRRIVLTGYPLQNNLLEYWCMVDFVRPNYLGSKTEFCNMFERPIQNGQCIDSTPQDIRLMRYRAHVLHSLLVGFVQRRSHAVLQSTLPQKEEYVLLIRMTPLQRKLYDRFMNEVVRSTSVPNPLKAFAICCKIWNHPDVLYNFLKKRSEVNAAIEEDLDLEEIGGVTKAGRARNSKAPPRRAAKPRGASKKPAATITPNTTTGPIQPRQEPNNYGNQSYPANGSYGVHGPPNTYRPDQPNQSYPPPYPNYQNPSTGYYPPNQGYGQNYDNNYYNQQQPYGNNYPNQYPQNNTEGYNQNYWGNSNYYGNQGYYNNPQYPNNQPPQDYRGNPPQEYRAQPPQDYRGNPPPDYRGNPPPDYRGNPPQEYRGNPPQEYRGNPPQDYRGNQPQEYRPNPPQDYRGNPPDYNNQYPPNYTAPPNEQQYPGNSVQPYPNQEGYANQRPPYQGYPNQPGYSEYTPNPQTPYPNNPPQEYPNQQFPTPYGNNTHPPSYGQNPAPYNQYDGQNYPGYSNNMPPNQNANQPIKSEPQSYPTEVKIEPNMQPNMPPNMGIARHPPSNMPQNVPPQMQHNVPPTMQQNMPPQNVPQNPPPSYGNTNYGYGTNTQSFPNQPENENGSYQNPYPNYPAHLKTEPPLGSASSGSPLTSWPLTEIKTEVDKLKAEEKEVKSESDGEVKIADLDTKKIVKDESKKQLSLNTTPPKVVKPETPKSKEKEAGKSEGTESEEEVVKKGRRGPKPKDNKKGDKPKAKPKGKAKGRKDRKTSKEKTNEDSESEESEKEEKMNREEELAMVKKAEEMTYDWATELLKDYIPGIIENSAKMELFFYILNESIKLGDRLLLFSQSLFTLNLIEDFLERNYIPGTNCLWERNKNYYRLDGSTHALEREKLINEFNANPHIYLFLVSTRAGSLGINLVGANRVIVFDASWNPCHDTQAVCRVYRYGQRKPCFVYRFVMDCCLEKKIYDRQINKQGMADRVVDECNPDAVLSMKEITNLCIDNDEKDNEPKDLSEFKDKYIDVLMQGVITHLSSRLSKEPFQHESLLVDRKEKKLSSAEKRLAQRGYELEKKAALAPKPTTAYRTVRTADGSIVQRPVASVRPMQHGARWIPADVWRRQGMTAQEMTLPLDVVIPTNSAEKTNIVLKAGQRVMVLKSPKGIYMQLESGKIIAIKTSFKGLQKGDNKDSPVGKKVLGNRPSSTNIPGSLKNNSAITITSRSGPRPGFQRIGNRPMLGGNKIRPMAPGQKLNEIRNRIGELKSYGTMRARSPMQARMLRPSLPGSLSITKITKDPKKPEDDSGIKRDVTSDDDTQVLDSDEDDANDKTKVTHKDTDSPKNPEENRPESSSENLKSNEKEADTQSYENQSNQEPQTQKPLVLTTDEKLPSEEALESKVVKERTVDYSKPREIPREVHREIHHEGHHETHHSPHEIHQDQANIMRGGDRIEKKINLLKNYRHQRPVNRGPNPIESSLSQLERTASVLNKEGMPDFRRNLDDITQSYSPNGEERNVKSKKKKSPNKAEGPESEKTITTMSHSVSSLLGSGGTTVQQKIRKDVQNTAPVAPIENPGRLSRPISHESMALSHGHVGLAGQSGHPSHPPHPSLPPHPSHPPHSSQLSHPQHPPHPPHPAHTLMTAGSPAPAGVDMTKGPPINVPHPPSLIPPNPMVAPGQPYPTPNPPPESPYGQYPPGYGMGYGGYASPAYYGGYGGGAAYYPGYGGAAPPGFGPAPTAPIAPPHAPEGYMPPNPQW